MSCNEPIEDPPPPARRLVSRLPNLLTISIAAALWRLSYPALMSADSFTQYGQALSRQYSDWHPVLMSLVLSLVLALGGTIGLLMLFQCLAGVFGVRALAAACLEQLYPRLPRQRVEWLSLLALLVLLLPVTPLAFYLMTLWKDAWAMVLLLWTCAFSLRVLQRAAGEGPPALRDLLILLALGVSFGLIRHNAIVTLPFLGLVLWAATRRFSRAAAWSLAATPLIAWILLGLTIDQLFHVRKRHPESQVMAMDLVGLCARDEAACAQLPFTQRHILDPGFRSHFQPGNVGLIFWQQPQVIDPAILAPNRFDELRAEYLRGAAAYPLRLARLKWEAFVPLLGCEETYYFFHSTIVDNHFGFTLNTRFQKVREGWAGVTRKVGVGPLRWLSGVHLVWLVANLAWLAGLLVRYRRAPETRYLALAAVLLIPLTYYLSYLLAAPVQDFRFMYPATLAVQCVTLAGALGAVSQKPTGRAPKTRRFAA